MRLAQTHGHAKRQAAAANGDLVASTPVQAGNYFPDSRVASNGTSFVSPVSYRGNMGPTATPEDILSLPRGGESPWIVPVQSDEQGVGRSPGQQWPWKVVGESYNLTQIDIMPFEFDQVYVDGFPDARTGKAWIGRQPPEHQGWSWPRYYEQYEGYATDPNTLGVLEDPQSAAYTVAWGSIDDDGSQAYG